MQRTVLILGAGIMQLPAIRAARRMGLYVIVADGNSEAVGIEQADEFLPVDLKEHEEMARAAAAIDRRRGLGAVFTAGTDFSSTAAYVAEELGLPGTSYEAALNATDKFRMRGVLREHGVAVPDFTVLTRDELERSGCSEAEGKVALPVVVKPVDSMGARGVVRADTWSEAVRFALEAVRYSRSGRVVIEGFIEGPEFSLDAIVYGDDIQITGFADRHIRFPPYFIEMGHTIPTALPEAQQQQVVAEFKRAIQALGIGPGAAKGDIKLSPDGAVVGEVAARLSGGYMSGWTYPLSSGVPLSEIGLRVALGDVPPRAVPRWNRTAAERAVISIPGILRELRGVEAARRTRGVEEVFVGRVPGDRTRFPRNNVEKVGNVIAAAPQRQVAVDAAEQAVRCIEPVLEPGDSETDAFLFGVPGAGGTASAGSGNRAYPDLCEQVSAGDQRGEWSAILSARARLFARPGRRLELAVPATLREAPETDWSCRTASESLSMLDDEPRVRIIYREASSVRLDETSRLFLRALAKGGGQGGRYVIDSLLTP